MRRYGADFHHNLQLAFAREQLVYNPPPEVVPNSHAALRLTELARLQGKHGVTHDRLMLAYWEQALNIGDPNVLRELATELELEDAEAAVGGNEGSEAVAWGTSQAHAIGIDAIPAFLLDRRLIVLGAQPAEVFEQAFAQLALRS